MTPGPGHNNGPALESTAWRRHAWGKARAALLPRLPIEVLRYRLKRAAEIGLEYRTYATVRASTGRDIVAILFSTNALRLLREDQALEAARAGKLAAIIGAERRALAIAPLRAEQVLRAVTAQYGAVLDGAAAAPALLGTWPQTVAALDAARPAKTPADAVLLVGDTGAERDWCAAGRFAGYLGSERYFTAVSG